VADQVRRATWLSRMLVRPFGQFGAAVAARLRPDLLAAVAQATRIPAGSIRSARDVALHAPQAPARWLAAPR
jgi:hypothetical protein